MRVHAAPGYTYAFAGTPLVTYLADCIGCMGKPWAQSHREFDSAAARDEWVRAHKADTTGHHVGVSTEVQASTS